MLLGLFTRVQCLWLGLQDRIRNEEGIVATEYLILLIFIALAIVAGATALGVAINNRLKTTSSCLTSASFSC